MAKRSSFVPSEQNKWKKKREVVADMTRKLASGDDVVAKLVKDEKAKRRQIFLIGAGVYVVLLGGVTATVFLFLTNRPATTVKQESAYTRPLESMENDHRNDSITVDQYALFLSYMLMHFDKVPQKYKGGVPRFSAGEIFAKLRDLWPRLDPRTKEHIGKELPQLVPESERRERPTEPPPGVL